MWKYIIGIVIFFFVLFFYLHIQFHLKTSDQLEVYELENGSKDKLEEICDFRQPVIMDFYNDPILKICNKHTILAKYHSFEMKIRNSKDEDYNGEIYLPLETHSAFKLFDEDRSGSYITENNQEFLQETGLIKLLQTEDSFIRPGLTCNCMYDFCTGSENSITPFRYNVNYRNYFYVTSGEIEIKLAPPKCSKYLHVIEDYDNFEFRSPVNPWLIQENYRHDFDKMKCMDVLIPAGKMIHIPAYWWYSIRYRRNSSIVCFQYRTYMNNITILPHIGIYFLQMQNVQHRVVKNYENKNVKAEVESCSDKEREKNVNDSNKESGEKGDESGVSDVNQLSVIEVDNELPLLNPVQEIEIPSFTPEKN